MSRAGISVVAGGVMMVACGWAVWRTMDVPDPAELLAGQRPAMLEVTDRHGQLLRYLPAADGIRSARLEPERASPHLIHAVLAAEDRRFFRHHGVDPIAAARAAWQDVRALRVVSGGSTLTMQLARMLDPRPRGVGAKLAQLGLALRLEWLLDKRQILAEYLSRAPFGNRVEGFGAAAAVYLGKSASQLSPAEAALLAAVPRAPSRINPWAAGPMLRFRRDAILGRMGELGFLTPAELAAARAEPVVLAGRPFRYPAPHFLARLEDELRPLAVGSIRAVSTLEPVLQGRVEQIVRTELANLASHGVGAMAVAILDVRRDEWLAIEGSGGFWDRPAGQLDGTRSPRQPGSALKPFTYAAAFDASCSPATVIPDVPASFTWSGGTWTPRNYDERFHGPLTARSALACSVNVPAAFLLHSIGPQTLLAELRRAGITTLAGPADRWGLGLTLGAGEVRLDELATAYAALLRGGEWRPAHTVRAVLDARGRVLRRAAPPTPVRVCSREAAAQVVDILADPEARSPAFGLDSVLRLPFAAAVKTGTSEGFRDNWCVGGTHDVVVAVWAGNFDRAPMGNVSGVTGAGAVWREVMLAWAAVLAPHQDLSARPTLEDPPSSLVRSNVCALSGLAPSPACPRVQAELLRRAAPSRGRCDWHERAPSGEVVVRWPPLYRAWAAEQGLLADSGQAGHADGPLDPTRGEALAVVAPTNGDVFVISPELPRAFQRLELRCSAGIAPAEIVWLVDGRESARVEPPYTTRWQLEPGSHRIQAVAGATRSEPVAITVYGR
jgi:penicillin-binding protein 1C